MIRPARTTDYDGFAALVRELGIADPAVRRDRWMSELVHGSLIDEHDGRVDGYVRFQTLGSIGYLRDVVVGERARLDGHALQLMLAAAAALRAAGVREWHLNVKTDNTQAIELSEQLGLRAEHRSTALRFPWSRRGELPCEPAIALPVDATDDDDIERALGLLAGQIAMARRHPTRMLLQLRAPDCAAVGFAAFDPVVAGARIFRTARPGYAGTQLAALWPHAKHEDLLLVLDDDDALTGLLVTHGATIKLSLLHYSGTLPEVVGM